MRNPGGACDSGDPGFPQLGRCRRRLTPVPRVLRRLHRRVLCRSRIGAGGRLHQAHRVYFEVSAELRSTRKGIGPLLIWRPAESFELSNASAATFGEPSSAFSDHKALESIGKVGDHNVRVQRWLEFLTAFDYTLEYRKGSANGNADFMSRLPEPATEHDRSGLTSLSPVEDGGIYVMRACGLKHSLLADSGCWFEWASAPQQKCCLGWAPFRLR